MMFKKFDLIDENEGKIIGYEWKAAATNHLVVLIHGIGETAQRYDRVMERLKENNISTISMDLRGHGESMGKRGHCAPRDKIFEDMDTLIEYGRRNYPDCKLVLYGHSMGGNFALDYRGRGRFNYIFSGYIITSPWIMLNNNIPKTAYKILKQLAKVMPQFTISSTVKEEALGNLENVLPYNKNPLVHNKISLQCAIECYEKGIMLMNGTNEDDHKAQETPLLLMHGDKDGICDINGSRRFYEKCGDSCEFIQWKNYLHELHNGNDEEDGSRVIETIINFIKGV